MVSYLYPRHYCLKNIKMQRKYLKAFSVKTLFTGIIAFFLIQAQAQDCNLIANGDFSEGFWQKGWQFKSQWPAFADQSTDMKGRALIQVVRSENYQNDAKFAISTDKITLEQGQKYQIRFEFSANKDLPCMVYIKNPNGDIFFSSKTNATTTTNVFQETFEFTGPNADNYEFELKLPTDKFYFYLDNVSVQNTECISGKVARKTTNEKLLKPQVLAENNSSQESTVAKPLPKAVTKKGFSNLEINGYIRFESVFRHLDERYRFQKDNSGVDPLTNNTILVNGMNWDYPYNNGRATGYREPLMMLEMKVQPIYNTFLKTDFIIDNQMVGNIMDTSSQTARRIEMYRYINAEVEHVKNWGTIRLKAGGVHFTQFSPLTFYSYEWRDDMFERYPWEWRNNSNEIYNQYYESSTVARDPRFANTSVGGFFVEGEKLPRNFSFKALFGKTGNANNGFLTFNSDNYKYVKAFRLAKIINGTEVGFNFYNQFAWQQNSGNARKKTSGKDEENIVTVNTSYANKLFSLAAEAGFSNFSTFNQLDTDSSAGIYKNTYYNFPSTPLMRVKLESSKILPNVPMYVLAYYIGKSYLNLNSSVLTSSPFGSVQQQMAYVSAYPNAVTELGQMTANRMSAVYAISPKFGKLKTSLGLGWSKQVSVDSMLPYISFQHRVASINRSRFWFYRSQAGDFYNLTNYWRRSWEELYISDKSVIKSKPCFITIDLNLKYKFTLAGKDLILSNYTNYNNVYAGTAPSVWKGNSLLNYIFNDAMFFYKLNKTFTLVGQYCIERAVSNGNRVMKFKGDNVKEGINQIGKSYGIGLDIITGARSGLYIRQKWYQHTDKNYQNILFSDGTVRSDSFKGYETSAEFKIFF